MPIYQAHQINNDCLCLLKVQANGTLLIHYEPLVVLSREFQQLESEIRRTTQTKAKDLFEKILNDPVLKVIFGPRSSFCDNLWEAWQEDRSITRLTDIFESNYTDKIRNLNLAVLAYRLSLTYEKCRNDDNIIAYSHRRIGWCPFPFKIDEDFSAEFFTNFGFGNASYFTVTLSYKGIRIVPLNFYIEYRFAQKTEIVTCSRRYDPQNENWLKAIEYVKDACNLYKQAPTAFVDRYLLGECNKLVSGLKRFALDDTFEFITSGYHYIIKKETRKLEDDELLSFRAAKITGALDFVEYIGELAHIGDISRVINEIELLNRSMKPILEQALVRIEPLLEQKKRRMIGFKILHDELSEEESYFRKERYRIKEEEYKLERYHPDFTEAAFNEQYPDYKIFEAKYKANSDAYYSLYGEISTAENYLKQFKDDLQSIDSYFEVK